MLLVGAVLAPVLARDDRRSPGTATAPSSPTPVPTATPPVPSRAAPRPGAAYPVRRLGELGDRSRIVNGRGAVELRYVRAPGNGTRLHFICSGCDAGTRLVERPSGVPVGGGPLADASDATAALDALAPRRSSRLVVDAPAAAEWTVTLTPFDVVPVHGSTFDGLGDDVVAVRARGDLRLTCAGAPSVRTLRRAPGAAEYAGGAAVRRTGGGTVDVPVPAGSDRVVVVVRCAGRWTLALP